MQRRFADRLAAIEVAEQARSDYAVGWALSQLTAAEFDLFVTFCYRDQAECGAVAHEGAEAAVVAHWQELYEFARLAGLRSEDPYYAPRTGEAAQILRAPGR